MSDLVCKKCGCNVLEFVKDWEVSAKGTRTKIELYKCSMCGAQNRKGTLIEKTDYKPKKRTKKEKKKRAVSIAKQIDLDRFQDMRRKLAPREIAALLCQHYTKEEDKARCQACLKSIYRLDRKLEALNKRDQSFDVFENFEEIPLVKEFIEDYVTRQVNWKKHVPTLRDYWVLLENKHPATWDEDDLKKIILYIREKQWTPYGKEQSLRQWFAFIDAKDDRGRNLVDHPLLEASRAKMVNPKTKGMKKDRTYVTPKEFMKVVEETQSLPFEAAIWTHVTLGCREGVKKQTMYNRGRGGLMGLDWSGVNWTRRTIDVMETKTKGSITWVDSPMDLFGPYCHDLLRQYWESRGRPTSGKMFAFEYRDYLRYFKTIVSPTVGRRITPHNMRDTHATWLINMNVKVEMIIGTTARRLGEGYALGVGWEEPRMFFEHYARLLQRSKDREIQAAQEGFRDYIEAD